MSCQSCGVESSGSQQSTNTSATSNQAPATVNSHGTAAVLSQGTRGSCSDTEMLNELMANLSENMSRQGVSTESKGLCAACSKPIIGQVLLSLITKHSHVYYSRFVSRLMVLMSLLFSSTAKVKLH